MINISGVGFVTVVALVAGMASVSEGKVLCPDGEGKSPPAHAWVNDDILVKGLVIDGVLERGHCDLKGVTVLGDIKVGPGGVLTLQRHNNQQDPINHISDIGGAGGEEDHHSTVTGDIKGKGADKIQLSHGTIVYGNFEAKDTVRTISIGGNFNDDNTIGGKVKIKGSQGSILIKRTSVGGKVVLKNNIDIITIRDSTLNQDVKIAKNDGLVFFGWSMSTGNRVDGMVKLKNNSGGVTVKHNDIWGDLKCKKNAEPIDVSDNTVGGKVKGQCAP